MSLCVRRGLAWLVWRSDQWEVFRAVDVGGALGAKPGSSELRMSLQERMAASVPVAPRGGRSSENRFYEDADVRVLDVLWDDHGERFRDWRSAVTESTQELCDVPLSRLKELWLSQHVAGGSFAKKTCE